MTLKSLNVLRVFLSLQVVFGHYNIFNSYYGGGVAVNCFFILSGFIFGKIYKEETFCRSEFYLKRLARLLPSYYLIYFISCHLRCVRDLLTIFLLDTFGGMTPSCYTSLWAIQNFIMCYMFFPFVVGPAKKYSLIVMSSMSVVYIVCGLIMCLGFKMLVEFKVFPLMTLCLFVAGISLSDEAVSISMAWLIKNINLRLYFVVYISLFMIPYLINISYEPIITSFALPFSIVFQLVLILLIEHDEENSFILHNSFLQTLSESSFTVYIWHMFILYRLKKFICIENTSIKLLFITLQVYIFAYFFNKFFERPVNNLIMNLYKKYIQTSVRSESSTSSSKVQIEIQNSDVQIS